MLLFESANIVDFFLAIFWKNVFSETLQECGKDPKWKRWNFSSTLSRIYIIRWMCYTITKHCDHIQVISWCHLLFNLLFWPIHLPLKLLMKEDLVKKEHNLSIRDVLTNLGRPQMPVSRKIVSPEENLSSLITCTQSYPFLNLGFRLNIFQETSTR